MAAQPPSLKTLATYLAGEFDNQAQAFDEPAWYVPVRLWHRPLSIWRDRGFAFYAEQSNALKLDQPYRPRVFLISAPNGSIQMDYFQIKDPSPLRGGGRSPNKLTQLHPDNLIALPGCTLAVTPGANEFSARPQPGCQCQFTVDGTVREVELGFDAGPSHLNTYDKGINPDTGKPIWGALMGPYRYQKIGTYELTYELS